MEKESIQKLSLDELHVLLSGKSLELLKLVEEKKEPIVIRNKGQEIEIIQSIIDSRKNSMGNQSTR